MLDYRCIQLTPGILATVKTLDGRPLLSATDGLELELPEILKLLPGSS